MRTGSYSRLFKAAVRTLATDHRGPRHRRDLHRPHRRGACRRIAKRSRAVAPTIHGGARARRDRDQARRARTATSLSCSIAVAPNKLLAKIASELDKPDGLTLLRRADIPLRIWPLPPRKINGVGPKSSAKLEALGIRTIGELAQADPEWLSAAVRRALRRRGCTRRRTVATSAPCVTYMEPKSISRETTFERDLSARRDREALSKIFTELCAGVGDDLKRKGYVARTIGPQAALRRFQDGHARQDAGSATRDARAIRHAAGECLKRVPLERAHPPARCARDRADGPRRGGEPRRRRTPVALRCSIELSLQQRTSRAIRHCARHCLPARRLALRTPRTSAARRRRFASSGPTTRSA